MCQRRAKLPRTPRLSTWREQAGCLPRRPTHKVHESPVLLRRPVNIDRAQVPRDSASLGSDARPASLEQDVIGGALNPLVALFVPAVRHVRKSIVPPGSKLIAVFAVNRQGDGSRPQHVPIIARHQPLRLGPAQLRYVLAGSLLGEACSALPVRRSSSKAVSNSPSLGFRSLRASARFFVLRLTSTFAAPNAAATSAETRMFR